MCMTPDCKHAVKCRGLCGCCYNTALVLVRTGNTTWEKLEQAGLALPAQRSTSADSPFLTAFHAQQDTA